MNTAFVVFSLPRSRTTWLSRFLTYGDWHCGHDELRHMRQLEDVRSWLAQPNTGTVETAAAPFWRLALHLVPDLRIVTIRRDPDEAAASAVRAGLGKDLRAMAIHFRQMDHKLGQIERRTGCRSFQYEDLKRHEVCADLFMHLLPYCPSYARWAALDQENIQTSVAPLARYVNAHARQFERLNAIARQKSLALLHSKRMPDIGGITLGFEVFADFMRDGQDLIREHIAEVGDHPDSVSAKNLPRLQELDEVGALQVAVARCNGRPFGYLITILGESLEAVGRQWACHTAFFCSSSIPGLGLRLQRKALEGLRERGIYEVMARAGVRGAADRQSILFKRLGFEPFGSYHRLQLEEAA